MHCHKTPSLQTEIIHGGTPKDYFWDKVGTDTEARSTVIAFPEYYTEFGGRIRQQNECREACLL